MSLTAPKGLVKAVGSWEQIEESCRFDMQMLPAIGTSNSPIDEAQVTQKMVPWPVWDRPNTT